MNMIRNLAAAAACSILIGCSPLAPQPDHSKFFILSPVSDGIVPASTSAATTSQLTLGVGPISFPDYLRRPEVVTLASPNQIDLSAEKRWGEPLDKDFTRVLTENLTRLLNTQKIEKYPWNRKLHVDYQIEADVVSFQAAAGGQSQLVARWIIRNGEDGKELYATETTSSSPVSNGETGASAALSQDLAVLSRDIAAQITSLNERKVNRAETERPTRRD